MYWYVPVVCRIVTGYIAIPILLKPIVDKYPHSTMLFLQFMFCFVATLPVAVALNQHRVDWTIVAVGFVNGLAAYCYRKAIAMSLSRTALLAFWDDLLAMGLSYVLLHEGQFLTTGIVLGMGASLGAVILFTVHSYRKQQTGKDEPDIIPKRLYLLAGAYSVILGVGVFFMRYLGVKNTGLGTFLMNWYGGVVLAAGLLLLVAPEEERKDPVVVATLPREDLLRVLGLSLLVLVTMSAAYTAYRLAPQTVVQPLFLVGEMIAPALIGLYVFAEREALERQEHLYFGLGLAGGLLVALSFSGVL
jgi:hypothetical protein